MANQAHNLSIFNLQIEIAQSRFITIQLTNILKFNHGLTPIFIYVIYYYYSAFILKINILYKIVKNLLFSITQTFESRDTL